jgi:uncharacterized protein YjbI with pentapeptide repeats
VTSLLFADGLFSEGADLLKAVSEGADLLKAVSEGADLLKALLISATTPAYGGHDPPRLDFTNSSMGTDNRSAREPST